MQKGQIKVNNDSVSAIVVASRAYKGDVDTGILEIKRLCQQLLDNESLKGGDGELIREAARTLADRTQNLAKSADEIWKKLDKLVVLIAEAQGGRTAGNLHETVNKAGKNIGIYKKD